MATTADLTTAAVFGLAVHLAHALVDLACVGRGVGDPLGQTAHHLGGAGHGQRLPLCAQRQIIGRHIDLARADFNIVGCLGHAQHHAADVEAHVVEIFGNAGIGVGQLVQLGAQIARGHGRKPLAQRIDHRQAPFLLHLEIGAQRRLHVEQRGLDQRGHRPRLGPVAWKRNRAHHHARHDFLKHQRIAADVEVGCQADGGVNLADLFGAAHGGGVEGAGKQLFPMAELKVGGLVAPRIIGQQRRGNGMARNLFVKLAKRAASMADDGCLDSGETAVIGAVQFHQRRVWRGLGQSVRHLGKLQKDKPV
jgi:hypothetical protein